MTSLRDALPPEGDQDEATLLVAQHPIRLPTYRLERVNVAVLNVDYAPPAGNGYARVLSAHRLKQLREQWDPLAVSPLTLSRRSDNTLWIIDGNHRRYIAWEKSMFQLPAMVHSGLERAQEADLYGKLGTVLGQTPWTRFQAKSVAGSDSAADIVKIAARYDLEINGGYGSTDGKIQAVARVEWIYARGGADGLNWVLGFLTNAFGGARDALGEMQLEGVFGFYVRYADLVNRDEVAGMLGASGINAWYDRAASLYSRVDVGGRSNTYGLAIAEFINDVWRKKGVKAKDLLPAWETKINQYTARFREITFSDRSAAVQWRTTSQAHGLAPQQLGVGT